MTVKELMSTNVYFISSDAPVTSAAALMKKNNIGLVPVCDSKGCLLGLITDRDIVLRALTDDKKKLEELIVSDVMTKDIVTISPEMDIHDAACIFSQKEFIVCLFWKIPAWLAYFPYPIWQKREFSSPKWAILWAQ